MIIRSAHTITLAIFVGTLGFQTVALGGEFREEFSALCVAGHEVNKRKWIRRKKLDKKPDLPIADSTIASNAIIDARLHKWCACLSERFESGGVISDFVRELLLNAYRSEFGDQRQRALSQRKLPKLTPQEAGTHFVRIYTIAHLCVAQVCHSEKAPKMLTHCERVFGGWQLRQRRGWWN